MTAVYYESDTYNDAPINITVTVQQAPEPTMPFIDASLEHATRDVENWSDYVGQEPLKAQLRVYIDEALADWMPLPHIMLASGMPGVGKTEMAGLIAKEMNVRFVKLVPPFSAEALFDAAQSMDDYEILFIDEIHKLSDHGPAMAENLLHIMEEGALYTPQGRIQLKEFTLVGATTDVDKLPEAVVDRFMVKPYFQPYSIDELHDIAMNFARRRDYELSPRNAETIARACRGTPRVAREMVIGARALSKSLHRDPTPAELLAFKEVDANGMTRQHAKYIVTIFKSFGTETKDGGREYVAGEASLMTVLRENKPGLARLERFLIEIGYVDRTPRGRRLTARGIEFAKQHCDVA